MRYKDLRELVDSSSSTRRYFLSLPVNMQLALSERNDYIHTAEELHRTVSMVEICKHLSELSDKET